LPISKRNTPKSRNNVQKRSDVRNSQKRRMRAQKSLSISKRNILTLEHPAHVLHWRCQSFRCGYYHHILCPKCMKVWKKGKMGKIDECELYKKKLSEECRIKDLFRYFPNPCAVCPWPERPAPQPSKQHTRLVPLDILYWTERTHREWPGWSGNIGNLPCSISEGGNVIFAPWSTVPVHIETCGGKGGRARRRRRRGVRCHYMRIIE